MARATKPLTARRVDALKIPGRYRDAESRGLYLQVQDGAKGITKSWLLRYQVNGKERWMGLGSARDFSLKEARERARQKRQLLADGTDPIEAKIKAKDEAAKDARERLTFKDATEAFLRLHAPTWKNDKHRKQWRASLKEHAFPKLAERQVANIDAAMINEAVMPIWNKTPETARRVKQRIERVVQWVKDGKPLPTSGGNSKRRSHPALPWQEIPQFMIELTQKQGVSARALEFTVLTAARTGEVIDATWDEIDLDTKTWTVPAKRMKAGREHRVPLSARVVEILQSLPREKGNDFVFIGSRKGEGLSNMAMLELLRGMHPGVTVHGFRSTFTDWAHETTNTPSTVVEAALAHVVGDKTEAAYRRGDLLAKRRKLMNDWTRYCQSKPAEVVTMPKKRRVTA